MAQRISSSATLSCASARGSIITGRPSRSASRITVLLTSSRSRTVSARSGARPLTTELLPSPCTMTRQPRSAPSKATTASSAASSRAPATSGPSACSCSSASALQSSSGPSSKRSVRGTAHG
ncbi:MAG TPA: hypothetical protein DEF51_12870 [Myxococcales bacterium]|nr:hypothetical protein [Myxococcales bacterium]